MPFLAHATLEPSTARPSSSAASATSPARSSSSRARNTVLLLVSACRRRSMFHTTFLGGGYGRKLELTFQIQVAQLPKAAGKPVKMI